MRAIAMVPETRAVRLVEREEPMIASPDEIKIKIIRTGICGTDREKTMGAGIKAAPGQKDIVLGHEMVGLVVEAGSRVKKVKPGDFAALTIRRGCGKCMPCAMNRADMCQTGEFTERGLQGLDGFQTEFVVDREENAVFVPAEIADLGVLCEPLSVVEKGIDELIRIEFSRLPVAAVRPDYFYGKKCLVAGLGPVGLLASLALVLRGASVAGLDVVDENSARPAWLKGIGGKYLDCRKAPPSRIEDTLEPVDIIFEAAGAPKLAFELLDVLKRNGIYVLSGIPVGEKPVELPAGELMRRLVKDNQLLFGTVSSAVDHFQMAVRDLTVGKMKWGTHLDKLITHRHSQEEFKTVFKEHPQDEIKAVVGWG